ncbi:helix-turn-helix domain-containing protein [Halococcus hamelinensis]|uniref:helix-turn-helix domain-containing protein n=1 Tax=Halococcus hamelinensis TaxID=332168 RepID=UPI00029A8530|nr:helix-turn-helix domain-containing protein [Halococcus hamelinensis]
MSLIATYQLDTPVYDSLFEEVPDLRLEVEQAVACSPDSLSVTVWAETDRWTAFETELERSETVKGSQHLRSEDDQALYQIWVPVSETTYWDWTSLGSVLLSATITRHGATVRMEFPDHEALSTYRDWCLEQDIQFSLNSLSDASSGSPLNFQSLTSSQREVIALAVEHGYFEVPRGISMIELAAECGISDQAASERLRRGLSNLLGDGRFDTLWASSPESALEAK